MPTKDKAKQKIWAHESYVRNKERVKARSKLSDAVLTKRNRDYVTQYLREHPCIDCGNSDIRVLEFDHVRGIKIKAISQMVQDANSIVKIEEEIAKCEVRCANCHRIKTKLSYNNASIA